MTYMTGKAILGVSNMPNPEKILSLSSAIELIKHSPMILVDLTVGGIVLGLPLCIVAYYMVLTTVVNYRKRIKPKLSKKRQDRKARKRKKRNRRN